MIKEILIVGLVLLVYSSCQEATQQVIPEWKSYDESAMLASVADHENSRMHLKLVQSKVSDKNDIWASINEDIAPFSAAQYDELYPLIYERTIPQIQEAITSGALTYELLTMWYLHRIARYENDSTTTLHTIIALNADAVETARKRDQNRSEADHPIYGMPILLKDNINTSGMSTTAGALILKDNMASDAHIVSQLKSNGAIILGKANLSEWAYYFCGGCPVGYSAIGGQTLNPYGRGIYETGGSSSGGGTSTSANYAVGAVGTETSGSILSPSGKNSVVGLKPTIGLLSRSGIVPISSTLDTPGPMTKSVIDNAILLSAMTGADPTDGATAGIDDQVDYLTNLTEGSLDGKRLGASKAFIEADSMYAAAVEGLKSLGAEIIIYEAPEVSLNGFGTLLDADMKRDLPAYLKTHAGAGVTIDGVQDIVDYNTQDTSIRAPYGQIRLVGSAQDTTSDEELRALSDRLQVEGRKHFDIPIAEHDLDAILSIDNYSAGFAAVAKYPCLTVPMGYRPNGGPTNLTFIAPTEQEGLLLQLGYAYEQATKNRKAPF